MIIFAIYYNYYPVFLYIINIRPITQAKDAHFEKCYRNVK